MAAVLLWLLRFGTQGERALVWFEGVESLMVFLEGGGWWKKPFLFYKHVKLVWLQRNA